MPILRIARTDGEVEEVRSYTIAGGRVRLLRADATTAELELGQVDFEKTFADNVGLDFDAGSTPMPAGEPVLELVVKTEEPAGDYVVVEGLVRSLAGVELANVVAKVTGHDDAGGFVTSEEALIDWNPLQPRAESPFRVVLKGRGKVRTVRLVFRSLMGDPLPTRGLHGQR